MSIIFGNKDLENISKLYVEDIVVSPVTLNPVARQRAVAWGADFVRMGGGTRSVAITFALLEQDATKREKLMQSVREWAQVGSEKTLELPQFANKHLECAVTLFPEHSYRKWWENKIRIELTCFNNPYWTSNELIEVPCGTSFTIGGNAPPLVTIERTGTTPLTNQTYSTSTASMTFSTIPAGSMVIDLNRQTAAIGKTSFMKYYAPTSTWIVPKIGAGQVINGVGTVKYRERWV